MTALASQLPSVQNIAQGRKLTKQESALNEQWEAISNTYGGGGEAIPKSKLGEVVPLTEQMTEVAKKRFELNPSEKTYKAFRGSKARQEIYSSMARTMGNSHMQSMGTQQVLQREKRRNFMDYLRSEPTSLGGNVGELPTHLQEQIASQYSRSERKALMDRVDREKK